eukprot:scaffold2923_cov112-Isochrysis_galbana.AAC.5
MGRSDSGVRAGWRWAARHGWRTRVTGVVRGAGLNAASEVHRAGAGWSHPTEVEQPGGHLRPPSHVRCQPLHLEALPADRLERRLELVLVLPWHRPLQRLHCAQHRLVNLAAVSPGDANQVGRLWVILPPVGEDAGAAPAALDGWVRRVT